MCRHELPKSLQAHAHVASTEPIVDTFVAPEAAAKPALSEEKRVEVLAAEGQLTRLDRGGLALTTK